MNHFRRPRSLTALDLQPLRDFHKIVDHIQKKLEMEGREAPSKSQMIENALFQVDADDGCA